MPDRRQLLLDYGQVISRPPGPQAWQRLVRAAGLPEADLTGRYWEHLVPYDAGQPTEVYWTAVLGRTPAAEQLRDLVDADVAGWLDLEPAVLEALRFRHLLFSADLGLVKPDPRVYAVAVERLAARAQDVVFVDDRAENVEAAAAAGLPAVRHTGDLDWLVTTGLLPHRPAFDPPTAARDPESDR